MSLSRWGVGLYFTDMNAQPLLARVARALNECGLEAVLVGNAAAALHGSPVTTTDFDFMFRDTPLNRRKLKRVATSLGATIFRPFYPVSSLYRVIHDDAGLQLDFTPRLDGIRSLASLRSRAVRLEIGGASLLVADLEDVIRSKRAANRPRDRAVLPVLEATLDERRKRKT